MSESRAVGRRQLLKTLAGIGIGAVATPILAACQPKVVEKIVKETVMVEGEAKVVEVEKVVKETVVVEKEKVVVEKAADVPVVRIMTRPGPLGIFMSEFAKRYSEETGSFRPKVELGNWEDMSTKLMTAAMAGTLADVFWQDYFLIPIHFHNGVMLDMKDQYDGWGGDKTVWYPWAMEMMQWEGKLLGMPLSINMGYNKVIYNKELIAKAGVSEPDGPNMGWNDFIEIAKGIKESTGMWGIDVGHWWWGTETICHNFDTNIVTFLGDKSHLLDEKTQVVMKMIYDLGNTDKVMPTASAMEGDRNKMFSGGKLAMMVNCAADLVCGMSDSIGGRFAYGYTTTPQKDSGLLGTLRQPNSIHVFAKTKYPEQCFGLCTEIAGVEASKWTAMSSGMTPGACPAAWTDPDVVAKFPLYGQEGEWLSKNVPKIENTPMPKNLGFNELGAAWNAKWGPVKNGEKPFDKATMDDIDATFQAILNKPIA